MPNPSVLVVDDSPEMVATLSRYLGDHGWSVETAHGGAEAIERFEREPVDVVLTDLRMKGTDGIDVLEGIRRADEKTPVVLMTAFGSVESAVDAIQRGAYNYVTKPFKMATVRTFLERAVADRRTRNEGRELRTATRERFAARGLVGASAAMRELAALVERVARTSSPVLITGETGTGKELVARAIHFESDRRDAPFVTVSCAALPERVLESELFGQAVGALPGASARRGLFAEADGGTIFLDEVADLPLALQGKLLRVLESGEIRAVGGDEPHTVDVRCIASTHADLADLVRVRTFREDLFFRLDVIPVRMVPLRERREDIAGLVEHFLTRAQERYKDSTRRRLSSDALRVVEEHDWPGNVRELENVIQRLVVTTTRSEIDADAVRTALTPLSLRDPTDALAAAHLSLEDLETRYVDAVLRQARGNKADAAAILGIDVSTIYRWRSRQRRR
ncbi:MAG TPA: sigma-54 dependent transcriptional regulator [Polyangia bacterium]|nr:sigma-54 dependent transcriptional regulator [Polyangia bacterium]